MHGLERPLVSRVREIRMHGLVGGREPNFRLQAEER